MIVVICVQRIAVMVLAMKMEFAFVLVTGKVVYLLLTNRSKLTSNKDLIALNAMSFGLVIVVICAQRIAAMVLAMLKEFVNVSPRGLRNIMEKIVSNPR